MSIKRVRRASPARWFVAAAALLVLHSGAASAGAQVARNPQRAGAQAPGDMPRVTAADVQAWFDAMVLVQAQRALGLTDAQYPQFVGRLKALQDTRRRNQRQRAQLLQEIQRIVNARDGAGDEALVRDKLKALDDLQEKAAADVRKAYASLDEVLDLAQRARFRIFEEQIERRKFEILLNARRGRGAPR